MMRSASLVPNRLRTAVCLLRGTEHRPLCTSVNHRENVLYASIDGKNNLHPAVRAALSMENASRSEVSRLNVLRCVEEYRRSPSDTGSPEVQVAVMTERIRSLTEHLKVHRKDKNTERSVVMLVSKRRGMMRYLLRKSPDRYLELVGRLGLREGSVFSKDVGTLGAKNKPSPILRRG